jgi:glucose dehydrogenase
MSISRANAMSTGFRAALLASAVVLLGISWAVAADERALRQAGEDPANWLTYSRGFYNQRHSPLTEIDRSNVRRLVPKWIYQTGLSGTFQASPLVEDGKMYVSLPNNHVVALDAGSGDLIWRYNHKLTIEKLCCGPANRGLALGYGRLYMITVDARLIALDQETGKIVWETPVADPNTGAAESVEVLLDSDKHKAGDVSGWTGFTGNMAPLVFDGMVIVGVTGAGYGLHLGGTPDKPISVIGMSGSQFGLRAFLSAYDAATGKMVWRWYTTADGNWEGEFAAKTRSGDPLDRNIPAEKAAAGQNREAWRRGGGSLWTHPALDPDLGLIYVGTGNPAPQMDDFSRPGDNLYTVSIVALDVHTGKMKWFDQHVPHDRWGYDVATPGVLFDLDVEGKKVPVLAQASKPGWMYVYERATGRLIRRSEAFVPQSNLFRRPTREGIVVAPGAAGGPSWSPASYDPQSGLLYVAAMHMPMRYTVHELPPEKRQNGPTYVSADSIDGVESYGIVSAIDPKTGKVAWQQRTPQILIGGLVTTAGGLLFMGEGNGKFTARDLDDGKLLWSFQTGAGVNAPPIVYRAKGREFVAVASGGHQLFGFAPGGAVIGFGLAD